VETARPRAAQGLPFGPGTRRLHSQPGGRTLPSNAVPLTAISLDVR